MNELEEGQDGCGFRIQGKAYDCLRLKRGCNCKSTVLEERILVSYPKQSDRLSGLGQKFELDEKNELNTKDFRKYYGVANMR